MKSAFPYRSLCVSLILFPLSILAVVSSLLWFRIYPSIVARNERMRLEEIERARLHDIEVNHGFLSWNLMRNYYRLRPVDAGRFFDCKWKSHDVVPQPFAPYPYMRFFDSEKTTDIYNGVADVNDWPQLMYTRNMDRYNHRSSRVLLGIRGSDYGIHKSNLPMEILAMVERNENFKNDLIFLPDNFVYIDADSMNIQKSRLQAACHNRVYDGGRYVSNEWLSFDIFWDTYDSIFTNSEGKVNQDVFIFAYSNGSSPRHQLMKVRKTGECGDDTVEEYAKCHKIADERAFRIKAIVDIETNYDYPNLMPTAMFIRQNISGYPGRYYYAVCASTDCPVSNHRTLIALLQLKPKQMKPGWVRFQDETGRVVVDMLEPHGEVQLSHSSVIPFAIKEFEKITSGF